MMKKSSVFFWIAGLFLFWGCETKIPHYEEVLVEVKPHSEKERQLIKNFVEYWHIRIKGKPKEALQYELPYQKYIDGWKGYKAKVVPLNKDTKIVLKSIEYPHPDVAIVTRKIILNENRSWIKNDKWIYVEGKWYHKYYQNILPPLNEEDARFQ